MCWALCRSEGSRENEQSPAILLDSSNSQNKRGVIITWYTFISKALDNSLHFRLIDQAADSQIIWIMS